MSFGVRRGSVFGLLGTNGAGKTTLIKICYNLLAPTSGSVTVLGEDPLHHGRRIRARMGMVNSEERSFYWRLSGRRNLEFFAALQDMDRASAARRIAELGELTGIAGYLDAPFSDYSTGMRQKTAVARALLHDPEVLLMDEPCSALDPIATAKIEELIDGLRQNYCIVIVTHSMQQAARVSQLTAFFHLGTLVEFGDTDEVFTAPQEKRTQDYITGRFG